MTSDSSPAPLACATASASTQSLAELRIHRFDEERSHIALRGALDVSGTRRIEMLFTSVVTARRLPSIIELQHLTFLSSYAMCMLVMASRAIRLRGRLLVLVAPQPEIEKVLRATRLHQLIPIAATVAEAEALIEAHAVTSG